MNCPYCNKELIYHDWFGHNMKLDGSGVKCGDIYKCENEKCEVCGQTFYTRGNSDELKEGFPC